MRHDDWIAGYSDNGDGSVTWHINGGDCCTSPIHDHRNSYSEDPMTTTRPTTTKPKHGFIRSVLAIAGLFLVGWVTREYLTASSVPGSALVTSGTANAVAMFVMVAVAVAALLLSKRRGRTRR